MVTPTKVLKKWSLFEGDKVIWMTGALRDLESRGETGGRLDVSSGDKADYSAG